ncbi:hypothetical protein FKM82_013095 [Ascaphus truei]|uniref:serine protease inhibitor swm-1-like isoform X3 n=1 Tax=Ascaphus truei TaxID=8439 RepID=UPI003F5A29FE
MLHRALITLSLALVLPMMLVTSTVAPPTGAPAGFAGHGPAVHCWDNQQYYSPCKPCPKSCGDLKVACDHSCHPGCSCKPGYVLEHPTSNKCILLKDCKICSKNEVYVACYKPCEENTCAIHEQPHCVHHCNPGCKCKPGYVRYHGKCIKRSDCPH